MTSDGIARYKFPEKAISASDTLENGLEPKRVESVNPRLAFDSNNAMMTVRKLDTVAREIEVMKDCTNKASRKIREKSAPIPSMTITTKGKMKNRVNRPITAH